MGKFEGAGFDKIIFLNSVNGWYYNNTSHFFIVTLRIQTQQLLLQYFQKTINETLKIGRFPNPL